jgi:hypothetical protein
VLDLLPYEGTMDAVLQLIKKEELNHNYDISLFRVRPLHPPFSEVFCMPLNLSPSFFLSSERVVTCSPSKIR